MIEPQDAEKKSHVADSCGDERFLCRGRSAWPLNPETDKQIRRESDQFPKDKEEQQTVGDDHAQHRARKKRKVSEEAAEIFILGHVADAEDKNAKTDERDHDQHRGREWIENKPDAQGLLPECKPGKILDGAETMRMQRRDKGEDRHRQGCELSNDGERSGCTTCSFAKGQN